jgi:hypothetical protein
MRLPLPFISLLHLSAIGHIHEAVCDIFVYTPLTDDTIAVIHTHPTLSLSLSLSLSPSLFCCEYALPPLTFDCISAPFFLQKELAANLQDARPRLCSTVMKSLLAQPGLSRGLAKQLHNIIVTMLGEKVDWKDI